MVNIELLESVLTHIKRYPEEWHQAVWAERGPACGTAYCFAGHTAVMSGYEIAWANQGSGVFGATKVEGGQFIDTIAARELGLDFVDADRLFESSNSLENLYDIASQLTDGAIDADGWKD